MKIHPYDFYITIILFIICANFYIGHFSVASQLASA